MNYSKLTSTVAFVFILSTEINGAQQKDDSIPLLTTAIELSANVDSPDPHSLNREFAVLDWARTVKELDPTLSDSAAKTLAFDTLKKVEEMQATDPGWFTSGRYSISTDAMRREHALVENIVDTASEINPTSVPLSTIYKLAGIKMDIDQHKLFQQYPDLYGTIVLRDRLTKLKEDQAYRDDAKSLGIELPLELDVLDSNESILKKTREQIPALESVFKDANTDKPPLQPKRANEHIQSVVKRNEKTWSKVYTRIADNAELTRAQKTIIVNQEFRNAELTAFILSELVGGDRKKEILALYLGQIQIGRTIALASLDLLSPLEFVHGFTRGFQIFSDGFRPSDTKLILQAIQEVSNQLAQLDQSMRKHFIVVFEMLKIIDERMVREAVFLRRSISAMQLDLSILKYDVSKIRDRVDRGFDEAMRNERENSLVEFRMLLSKSDDLNIADDVTQEKLRELLRELFSFCNDKSRLPCNTGSVAKAAELESLLSTASVSLYSAMPAFERVGFLARLGNTLGYCLDVDIPNPLMWEQAANCYVESVVNNWHNTFDKFDESNINKTLEELDSIIESGESLLLFCSATLQPEGAAAEVIEESLACILGKTVGSRWESFKVELNPFIVARKKLNHSLVANGVDVYGEPSQSFRGNVGPHEAIAKLLDNYPELIGETGEARMNELLNDDTLFYDSLLKPIPPGSKITTSCNDLNIPEDFMSTYQDRRNSVLGVNERAKLPWAYQEGYRYPGNEILGPGEWVNLGLGLGWKGEQFHLGDGLQVYLLAPIRDVAAEQKLVEPNGRLGIAGIIPNSVVLANYLFSRRQVAQSEVKGNVKMFYDHVGFTPDWRPCVRIRVQFVIGDNEVVDIGEIECIGREAWSVGADADFKTFNDWARYDTYFSYLLGFMKSQPLLFGVDKAEWKASFKPEGLEKIEALVRQELVLLRGESEMKRPEITSAIDRIIGTGLAAKHFVAFSGMAGGTNQELLDAVQRDLNEIMNATALTSENWKNWTANDASFHEGDQKLEQLKTSLKLFSEQFKPFQSDIQMTLWRLKQLKIVISEFKNFSITKH